MESSFWLRSNFCPPALTRHRCSDKCDSQADRRTADTKKSAGYKGKCHSGLESTKIVPLLLIGSGHVMDDLEDHAHCLCRDVMYVEFAASDTAIGYTLREWQLQYCSMHRQWDHGLLERCKHLLGLLMHVLPQPVLTRGPWSAQRVQLQPLWGLAEYVPRRISPIRAPVS